MLKQTLRRLLLAIPMLLIVSFLVFVLIDLAPGDAAVSLAGDNPSPEVVEEIRQELGLDDPLLVRYGRWLADAVTGDLGTSFQTGEPVIDRIVDTAGVTISLVLVSVILSSIVAVIFGVVASLRPGGILDRLVTAISSIAIAMPPFWFGMLLILAFAINRSWLPALGYTSFTEDPWDWLQHLLLPAIALGALPGAELAMQLKASLTEELGRDYVLTARARGIGGRAVVLKHAMKNALIPVVTVFGFRLAQLLGGTVTIEWLFFLNGSGTLAINSTFQRDVPVLLGLVVVLTTVVIVLNLVVDVSYSYFNPRTRR
jgi:peptide/nickel transport system permease protein